MILSRIESVRLDHRGRITMRIASKEHQAESDFNKEFAPFARGFDFSIGVLLSKNDANGLEKNLDIQPD